MARRRLRLAAPAALALCAAACTRDAEAASPLIERLEAGQHQNVVVYGTSLTAGGAWVGQLSTSLNAQYPGQITWFNAGLSGKASNSGVANLASAVLSHNPDAVFIEFGMNDAFTAYPAGDVDFGITLQRSRANLEAMIDAILAQSPGSQIVLQTMNPAWDAPNGNQSGAKRPQLAQYYQGYRDVAAEQSLLLIDHNAVWTALQANSLNKFQTHVADGTHPNSAGYSQFVTPSIRSALGAANGLALLVDPGTGRTLLQNQSGGPLELIGYTISSASGALRTQWASLSDQSVAGWVEAHPTANNLSELNPTGSLNLAPGATIRFGDAWNSAMPVDLSLLYQTTDGAAYSGVVVYTTDAAIRGRAGDFDGDADVDGADLLLWQRAAGGSAAPFTGVDHSGDRVIDGADLQIWASHFAGPAASRTVHAVPEPSTLGIALGSALIVVARLRCDGLSKAPPPGREAEREGDAPDARRQRRAPGEAPHD